MTVREATKEAYGEMATEFSILKIISRTRELTERPYLTDGTITRRLRELREDHLINYDVIDNRKSKYKKVKVRSQLELKL